MIKKLPQLVLPLSLILFVSACSNKEISPYVEDERPQIEQIKAPILEKSNLKKSMQSSKDTHKPLDPKLSINELEAQKFSTETPKHDPSLGGQSSESKSEKTPSTKNRQQESKEQTRSQHELEQEQSPQQNKGTDKEVPKHDAKSLQTKDLKAKNLDILGVKDKLDITHKQTQTTLENEAAGQHNHHGHDDHDQEGFIIPKTKHHWNMQRVIKIKP